MTTHIGRRQFIADLPVEQPTRNPMVNLETAKSLSVTLLPTLVSRADEVIE